jgi:hypothetical protein
MDENLKQLTEWNENNPIETHVRVSDQNNFTFDTVTTSGAKLLGDDVVVVWVGHIDLECVCNHFEPFEFYNEEEE